MLPATLDTAVEFLKGVGPKRAELLQKELGIFTCGQLLNYFPFRYIDRTRFYKINELGSDLPYVQILGRITSKELIGEKQKKRLVARLTDETGSIELVWFQSLKWVDENVTKGKVYIVFGKPTIFNGSFSISHPDLENYPRPATKTGN
ncbi:MAG: ATP-dependent DNA helicase RecG, partial [Sphingobacteriales bacterium]